MGQDLKDFQAKHPHLPGRLILQDLTSVIAQMPQDSNRGFEAMAHDFFTPQPVIGTLCCFTIRCPKATHTP